MRFMLTYTWKQPPDEEVMALIPAEEARFKELAEQGIAGALETAADQSTFWTVWNCASQDELQETLQTMPLYKFVNVDISLLSMASIPESDVKLAYERLKERMIKEGISVEEAYELEKADHPQLEEIVYGMAVDAIKAELSI